MNQQEIHTINSLVNQSGRRLVEITKAIKKTEEIKKTIQNVLTPKDIRMFSSDADFVVFGSIARNECTDGSDLDWTLLVDGEAHPEHLQIAHMINDSLTRIKLKKPGGSGMFGSLTFSHDLIHYIGGQRDSNTNISQRILLLLESKRIPLQGSFVDIGENSTAYTRVINGILQRYLEGDSGFSSKEGSKFNVPRFLLNDIVRFWRTMCVDFAYKEWEQQGAKWALRNIKLRMSRKLIFVSGILICYSCYINKNLLSSNKNRLNTLQDHLRNYVEMTPMEIVVDILSRNDTNKENIVRLLHSYNKFLALLNNREARLELEKIKPRDIYHNQTFIKARKFCAEFEDTLREIFFIEKTPLREFTYKYGVF